MGFLDKYLPAAKNLANPDHRNRKEAVNAQKSPKQEEFRRPRHIFQSMEEERMVTVTDVGMLF